MLLWVVMPTPEVGRNAARHSPQCSSRDAINVRWRRCVWLRAEFLPKWSHCRSFLHVTMDPDGFGLVSYKSSSTVVAESVYQFLRGSLYGAIWGMVTPFQMAPESPGVFKPAAPFSSLSSVYTNAAIFGSVLCVQRFGCKSLELMRRKQDVWNDLFGFGLAYMHYSTWLAKSERRLLMHNRVVGATVVGAVAYANLLV